VTKKEEIFLIGPDPDDNDLNISTISRFTDVFTFVVRSENGGIKPLIIGGKMPIFSSEESAVKWITS
jgi:hypothetical protein